MDEFRQKIKNRMLTIGSAMILALSLVLIILRRLPPSSGTFMDGFFSSFPPGLLFGGSILGVVQLLRCAKALKSDEELNRLYNAEHDEMTVMIRNSALGAAFFTTAAVLLLGCVIAGFYNYLVCLSLLGALLLQLTIGAAFKLYFRYKYISPADGEESEEDDEEIED